MCDQTISYALGTYVWVKLVNKVWWPGIVVKESDVPEHVLNTYVYKKKNLIAIVHFQSDNSFEVVTKMDSVCLYASVNKMKFVEKGYNDYTKQKKGMKVKCGFNMSNFVEDVVNIEQRIGGDIHIFKQFEIENEKYISIRSSINIKDLFLTSKQLKARERKLFLTPNKNAELNKSYTKPTKTVIPKIKPSTSQILGGEPNTRRPMLHNDSTELPLPKKRKYVKSNKKIVKNIKLQEEILKDWDNGKDQGENTTLNDNTNLEVPTDVSSTSNKVFDFDESNSKFSSENEISIYSPKSKRSVDKIETTLNDSSTTLNEFDKFVKEANNQIKKITEVKESSINSYNGSILTEDNEIIMEENNLMPSLKQTITNDNNYDKSSSNIDDSQPTSDNQLDPTVQGTMYCVNTVPLANLTKQSDNVPDIWAKFIRDRYNEVGNFMVNKSPQETLERIVIAKKKTKLSSPILSNVNLPDLVDFHIHPGGPPKGYDRVKAWVPFMENKLTKKVASKNLKTFQKLLKQDQHNVVINLNCKIVQHLS